MQTHHTLQINNAPYHYVESTVLLKSDENSEIILISTEFQPEDVKPDTDESDTRLTSEETHALIANASPDDTLYAIFDATMIYDPTIEIFKTPEEAIDYLQNVFFAEWEEDARKPLLPSIERMSAEIRANPLKQSKLNSDETDGEVREWISLESVSVFYAPVRRA